jgi:hypothetical protein
VNRSNRRPDLLSLSVMRAPVVLLLSLLVAVLAGTAAHAADSELGPPLSDDRATAMEPVISAAVVLDAVKPKAAPLRRFTTRCRALPVNDDLLAAFRSACRTEGDAFTAGVRLKTCGTAARCRARLHRYVVGLGRQARSARRYNTALARDVPDPECRAALRVSKAQLETVDTLRRNGQGIERAIQQGSLKSMARYMQRFFAINRAPLYDHRGRLDTFRSSCL